jgi:hypothetical protein
MAFIFRNQLDAVAARRTVDFYNTLSEKDARRFAAIESQRLGRGGVSYLAGLFGCGTRTIERGIAELDQLANDPAAGRVRRPGAGRKKRSKPKRNSMTT